MSVLDFNTDLIDYIASSPTPFHAVSALSARLESEGFQLLREDDEWQVGPGKYYVCRNGSSLAAFSLPDMDSLPEIRGRLRRTYHSNKSS